MIPRFSNPHTKVEIFVITAEDIIKRAGSLDNLCFDNHRSSRDVVNQVNFCYRTTIGAIQPVALKVWLILQ